MDKKKAPEREPFYSLEVYTNEIAIKSLIETLKKSGAISDRCAFFTKRENEQNFEDSMRKYINGH